MRAGWKNRMDERMYFEEKKMRQRKLVVDNKILAIAQEEDEKSFGSPAIMGAFRENWTATNYFRKLLDKPQTI